MKIKTSWIVAAGIAVVATGWILSGVLTGSEPESAEAAPTPASEAQAEAAPRVRTQVLQASDVQKYLSVYGRTEPTRDATVRAETAGRVEEVVVAKGSHVEKGQVLMRLAMNDRAARRAEAQAAVAQRELEFEQARKLARSDFASRTRVAQARAALDSARAALARVEEDIANVTIKAPFAGVFNDNLVDEGEYVAAGESVARVIDMDPVVVVAEISEREVDDIIVGSTGTVRLIDGRELPGRVSWVSAAANATTRTYPVEMDVANPDHSVAAGMTAELRVPLRTVSAHLVSPAVLTLSDSGAIGVKTVDDDNRVAFHEVDLVADGPDGMWLAGLPPRVQIITVGQEYVRPGQEVDPVPQGEDAVVSSLPASADTREAGE